jgi:hypothetical protein
MKNEKIRVRNRKIITMRDLFSAKERFHKELSRLPFEEKIKILIKMREIVDLKGTS